MNIQNAIVIAGNVKDAEAIYNKAYNCSYFLWNLYRRINRL